MTILLVEMELTELTPHACEEELDEFVAVIGNGGPLELIGPNWRMPVRIPTGEGSRLRDVDPDDKDHPLFRKGYSLGVEEWPPEQISRRISPEHFCRRCG